MQKELQREEQERRMKEHRQKDELIRGNLELMNQKLQLQKSICKIKGKLIGTGFFCYINYENKKIL